jgi:GT2 family glycosyltransferase
MTQTLAGEQLDQRRMTSVHPEMAGTQADRPLFSVVMVTFARDHLAPQTIAQVGAIADGRDDVEFILVDNNPDQTDRSSFLAPLARWQYVKLGYNKGVSARNDGALAACGTYLIFVDDDAFLHPLRAFDRYESAFRSNPKVAIVTARHIDHATGETPRDCFPHTDKSLPKTAPFKTFRFQGNGFAMTRAAFEAVGPMSQEFFYGLEEIDYAYRVIEAGYEIYYEPGCWVVERNDPGGRRAKKEVEEMRLTNKLIISFKYLPALYVPLNFALFSAYVFYLNRGRINPFRSFLNFLRWARAHPGSRRPIGRAAVSYIEKCGGAAWK